MAGAGCARPAMNMKQITRLHDFSTPCLSLICRATVRRRISPLFRQVVMGGKAIARQLRIIKFGAKFINLGFLHALT
jgi:hypothetical protein